MATHTRIKKQTFGKRHWALAVCVGILLIVVAWIAIDQKRDRDREDKRQSQLQPFYDTPAQAVGERPGTLLRAEPMDIDVPNGGQAVRVLYRSEQAEGQPSVASGIIFYPSAPAPPGSRPVVAWSHGTVGMGDECAPSRAEDPLAAINTWIGDMMQRGWVVAATDYAGLGTEGTEGYLIGRSEEKDVLNSIRAARSITEANAGTNFATWGHSQGGHAALFAGQEAPFYAPELHLVATAAAAPAAELKALFTEQYKSAAGWVIGPEVVTAWPSLHQGLAVKDVMTKTGERRYQALAEECAKQSGDEALLRRDVLKQDFFSKDPMSLPSWQAAASRETPAYGHGAIPILIIQGLKDEIVLPNTTALYVKHSCEAGSTLATEWLADQGHLTLGLVAGPTVATWLDDRFQGKPMDNECSQPLPVQPAT